MKCQRQPAILKNKPAKIAEVWEVHLTPSMFAAIKAEARRRKCSFSAVTRYCVFQLAERSGLRAFEYFRRLIRVQNAELSRSASKQRHMVCLYGEDVKLLRFAAIDMGITVSAFIRLALEIYLPSLAREIHSKGSVSVSEFTRHSIKRWKTIPRVAINQFSLPLVRRYLFNGFPPEEWWGPPLRNSIAAEAA